MPIHHAGGNAEYKMLIAIYIAVVVISLVVYLCGYLYEGIKHKDWSIRDDYNLAKMIGGEVLTLSLIVGLFALVALKIYEIL